MFDIGQQVVVVEDSANETVYSGPLPTKGCVYTIENIYRTPDDTLMLELVEFPSPFDGLFYAGFVAFAFRPLRKTDISIFTKILAPTPAPQDSKELV